MQEKHLFEYAIVRVVPRVEREEFMNVGVIVYCPGQRFLQVQYYLHTERIKWLYNDLNVTELEERLCAFANVCTGSGKGGTIGKLPIASRFRWLTAARSTILQTSPVHPGLCTDASEILGRLFNQLVQ